MLYIHSFGIWSVFASTGAASVISFVNMYSVHPSPPKRTDDYNDDDDDEDVYDDDGVFICLFPNV